MKELTRDTKLKLIQITDLPAWHQQLVQDKNDKATEGTVRTWADGKQHIKTIHGWRIATAAEVKRAKKIGPLESYTKESRIKNKQKKTKPVEKREPLKTKSEIHAAIENFKNTKEEKRYTLGTIAPRAKKRIKAATGLDPETVILETASLAHALQDKHNLQPNDLDEIKEIVDTTTDITLSPQKNNEGQPVIIFKKQEPNGVNLLMEFRAGKYELELQTAYRK